ncbi:MAG: FtsQ-type POTRA domain-containing protein [Candidatus Aminicenantes bacterium]|nr:FtsQ-type POTRA domain-containing protein [Candidatus Aminicenantes bacterium]
MATQISTTLGYKHRSAVAEPLHFRRKDSRSKTKKVRRKIRLKVKHILTYFFLIGGFFFSIQKSYLFLISWEKLNVSQVEIQCKKKSVEEKVRQFLKGKYLGNLILLDMDTLKKNLLTHPWIKDVHMRKSFPSTVRIDIKERVPFALLRSEALYLIDRDGVKLQKVDPEHSGSYPLLTDTHHFKNDVAPKLNLARECLDSLNISQELKVAAIDLSEYDNAKVKLKDSPTWIIIGNDNFRGKIEFLLTHQDILQHYGILEYVDLRFKNRLYIKPLENWARNNIISPGKEAN